MHKGACSRFQRGYERGSGGDRGAEGLLLLFFLVTHNPPSLTKDDGVFMEGCG